MTRLRSLAAILLVIALVATGATAQDDGGSKSETKIKAVIIEKVEPAPEKKECGPDCTKPCCAAAEGIGSQASPLEDPVIWNSTRRTLKAIGPVKEGCKGDGSCGDACGKSCDKKGSEGCGGGCGGEGSGAKTVGEARAVLMLGGAGAPNRDVLNAALSSLDDQIQKLKAEVETLRAAKMLAEAEVLMPQLQALKAHAAKIKALSGESKNTTSAVRILKAGGCGGKCGEGGGTFRVTGAKSGPAAVRILKAGGCGGKCGDKCDHAGKPCSDKCAGKACGGKCGEGGVSLRVFGGKSAPAAIRFLKAGGCGDKCGTPGKACGGKCGSKVRAFLGVAMAPTDGKGVRIVSTVPMSPAALGGIQADDILVVLNGEKVSSIEEVSRIIGALKPGADARLVLRRGDARHVLHLSLGSRPVEIEETVQIERPRATNRRVRLAQPRRIYEALKSRVARGPRGGAAGLAFPSVAVARPPTPRPAMMPEMAMLSAKLQELKAKAQHALAAGNFGQAAELSQAAHQIAQKLEQMQRAMFHGGPADHAAGLERRLASVEARLARIERMLQRIADSLDR